MSKLRTPLAVAGVAILFALVVRYVASPPSTRVRAGDLAPDFSLPHHTQPTARQTLADLRGSGVLLVRFDSRWPGSAVYLAELERVHRRFLQAGLVVVGVALDPQVEQPALQFLLANRGVSFTVLLDPDGRVTSPLYGPPRGKAETYLIDTQGRVVSVRLDLEHWTTQPRREELAALLPTPTPTRTPLDTPRPGS